MRGQRDRTVERDLSVDLYRVGAIAVVMVGHWLAASVTYRDSRFADENVLVGMPWTQWLTLAFQVIPVFFLVAGYSSVASWQAWRASDGRWATWLRHRAIGALAPTTAYLVVLLAASLASQLSEVDSVQVGYGAWAAVFHLWFLPVYLVLVAATPVLVAAHRRWAWALSAGSPRWWPLWTSPRWADGSAR